ncbi:hypothetical protein J437_LFUL015272 [Ladona fulva]|uniref:tRNA (adenine(58)-N(1))-methyltransferase non-catalytic subunit TRM6 n=1 Tax=Ladona fulva TaxID=123851 RepID=A0A8K0PCS7_LADFU|nr:hypothetical protein J437_LFUL015272 [Ladona fulva]
MNNRRLARISRKGYTLLGRDSVSLEGVIGCSPWTNFKMTPQVGCKGGKRCFNLEPVIENEVISDEEVNEKEILENKDNRTINDDGQSQSLSSTEIEALRDEGLSGKEIVNQIIAGSATFDKKTRYSQRKYLRKKESKHCLRERVSVRKTTLSSIAEILCSGGTGEGSRGGITGMRPDTLSQMLTALNIQWYCSSKSADVTKIQESVNYQGTMYIVYESSNWGLLVASLLNYLPAQNCRVLHLYPGHGIPTLIAPKALNLPDGKFSILSSVNIKALLQKLGKLSNLDIFSQNDAGNENVSKLGKSDTNFSSVQNVCDNKVDQSLDGNENGSTEGNDCDISIPGDTCKTDGSNEDKKVCEKSRDEEVSFDSFKSDEDNSTAKSVKRKAESIGDCADLESAAKKPRWEQEAEKAADLLKSRRADGLVVVASKEHPVSLVLALLPYLAPSRPLVVYCPYREPLLELYAVLKGMEPWVGKCKIFGSRETLCKMVNLRLTESWLRNYQVLPDRTHPEINMSPVGGYVLSGILVDHNDI